jgi:acetoin utilization deacetylase AcuC-like enzyme
MSNGKRRSERVVFYTHYLYTFPLPDTHKFPVDKYALLRERLAFSGLANGSNILQGPAATDDQLALVHTPDYIQKVHNGTLTDKELRELGFPWSPQLAERSRRSVGSTIMACRQALEHGLAVNLGGGTHHAFSDRGQGYCVYNDVAVAARLISSEGLAEHILIVDCDVHQGNGTAKILTDYPNLFTFSIHGQKNFPFRKEDSDLDIGLPNDTGDEDYLHALQSGLDQVLARFTPELVIYLAGADPYEKDRLGRLSLTKAGLKKRDELVCDTFITKQIPFTITLSGGYAPNLNDIVDIHFATIETALRAIDEVNPTNSFT